jgi:hypothetical protein
LSAARGRIIPHARKVVKGIFESPHDIHILFSGFPKQMHKISIIGLRGRTRQCDRNSNIRPIGIFSRARDPIGNFMHIRKPLSSLFLIQEKKKVRCGASVFVRSSGGKLVEN